MLHVSALIRHGCSLTLAALLLSGCSGAGGDAMMRERSPSVLLTSYAIANGMAEHGMITRIMEHRATKTEIARLIAIDHNTWQLIRQAAYSPSEANFSRADEGIRQILDYATPVPVAGTPGDPQKNTAP